MSLSYEMAPAIDLRPHLRHCTTFHSPSPFLLTPHHNNKESIHLLHLTQRRNHSKSLRPLLSSSSLNKPTRYAVLGAGFAGLSVAWHLLELTPKGSSVFVDVIDEVGIGGGASGAAGGLLHPYSPKARVLWRGADFWKECLKLLDIAERTHIANSGSDVTEQMVWRRGIIRPAMTLKNAEILKENSQNCLESCNIKLLDKDSAQNLIPYLSVPFNCAVHMPLAMNIHPERYLQALFLACKILAADSSASGYGAREIKFRNKTVERLQELAGEYDSLIVCLGAKVDTLPELSGKLPLRTCRGVITHFHLPDVIGDEYKAESPSILSDAWIAVRGSRNMLIGSTWDWNSRNYSSDVSGHEASAALDELIPKALSVYPAVSKWEFVRATAGLRAMPPLTPDGSLPLLGSIDAFIDENVGCKYWIIGGLGARGLLYHGLAGKLMAEAVISCNEDVIPSELKSWKEKAFVKRNHIVI